MVTGFLLGANPQKDGKSIQPTFMNFSTARAVIDVVVQMKTPEVIRSQNRTNINDLFNGMPPFTAQQAKDNQIQFNSNLKQGTVLIQRANRQFENAILKPGSPFIVTLPDAPSQFGARWGRSITRRLSHILKKGPKSQQFMQVQRQQLKGVVLHGCGAKIWEDDQRWAPKFVGMQDILIPTDTDIDLGNLTYFAVRREMRPGELLAKMEANPKSGWNKKLVYKIFDSMKDLTLGQGQTSTWMDSPEKWAEEWKQNLGYWGSDKAPVIRLWDFFHLERDDSGSESWKRCIVLDNDNGYPDIAMEGEGTEFIYQSKKPYARQLSEFIHFQFGDGNVVPPFKYHSIRSLGYLLYDTVYLANRLQIAFAEHVFEQMMTLLRVTDPADHSRVTKILLENKGIIPDGVTLVPSEERYKVDNNLVQTLGSNLRQLIGEAAASYVDDLNNGTQKEETATQAMIKQSQLNVMVGAMLNLAYNQEEQAYMEICRRFCIKDSRDADVKKFRKQVLDDGVPEQWLDVKLWDVSAVRTLGNGDRTLEISEANQLLQIMPQLQAINPDAPRIVMKRVVGAFANDALADELIPNNNSDEVSDSVHDAQLVFSALMDGVPVAPKKGVNVQEQIRVILMLMQTRVQQIEQTDGLGTPQDVQGLTMAAGYVEHAMQQLQQDKSQKQFLKESQDQLMQVMNVVKALAQRQQEQQQAQAEAQQQDPVAMAKIEIERMKMEMKQQMDEQQAQLDATIQQLMAQTEARSIQMKAEAEVRAKDQLADAEIARKNAVAAAEIARKDTQAEADIRIKKKQAEAQAAAAAKKPKKGE